MPRCFYYSPLPVNASRPVSTLTKLQHRCSIVAAPVIAFSAALLSVKNCLRVLGERVHRFARVDLRCSDTRQPTPAMLEHQVRITRSLTVKSLQPFHPCGQGLAKVSELKLTLGDLRGGRLESIDSTVA
jgi:hypothetical protein